MERLSIITENTTATSEDELSIFSKDKYSSNDVCRFSNSFRADCSISLRSRISVPKDILRRPKITWESPKVVGLMVLVLFCSLASASGIDGSDIEGSNKKEFEDFDLVGVGSNFGCSELSR
jgi:hypothetical protein